MNSFVLKTEFDSGMTNIPNIFLDEYMPKANGEYVKVYLSLLRALHGQFQTLSVASLADTLDHTESDILRALKYWEKQGLLRLECGEANVLKGIYLLKIPQTQEPTADIHIHGAQAPTQELTETSSVPLKKSYSRDKLAEFSVKPEIKQLLFVCEQYLKRPLPPKEVETILFFFDQLHFSADLIEYLVEYCVSKGSRSIHYIETVALAWAEAGIHTVAEAKEHTTTYRKGCFGVMKAFGINDRNPVDAEIKYIEKWLDQYGFTLDIILAACGRTMERLHKPSFEYADKILTDWHENKIRHLSDIDQLDKKHQQNSRQKKNPSNAKATGFTNFKQRDYDFEELERQLLESQ